MYEQVVSDINYGMNPLSLAHLSTTLIHSYTSLSLPLVHTLSQVSSIQSTCAPPTTGLSTLSSKVPQPSSVGVHFELGPKAASLSYTSTTSSVPGQAPVLSSVTPPTAVPPRAVSGITHRYKFSVDLRSIHNTAMDSTIRCYLRYFKATIICGYYIILAV